MLVQQASPDALFFLSDQLGILLDEPLQRICFLLGPVHQLVVTLGLQLIVTLWQTTM